MLQALEGSQAVARAVALCRPEVVAAYPITPQTHIVENISKLVADGELVTELVSVESEFSAASVALGAAAAGARAYTASSSQGIMLMTEVLYNISGLRIPMVLTCANRAVGAPLSIWNDHQDSMSVRDSGWIQLFCANNQEAVDTTIQAYRIAERTELPVMVCMDGFILTHTLEGIDIPDQDAVDAFLPPFEFARALDPLSPTSVGTLVTPDFYAEARHSHHAAMNAALTEIESVDRDWEAAIGRSCGGLLTTDGPDDAETVILAMGSITGTLAEAMDEAGSDVKLITLRAFRPFPVDALRAAVAGAKDLVVVDRSLSPGLGGVVGNEIRAILGAVPDAPRIHNVAVGLGGRDVPMDLLPRLIAVAGRDAPEHFEILDADLAKLPEEDR